MKSVVEAIRMGHGKQSLSQFLQAPITYFTYINDKVNDAMPTNPNSIAKTTHGFFNKEGQIRQRGVRSLELEIDLKKL